MLKKIYASLGIVILGKMEEISTPRLSGRQMQTSTPDRRTKQLSESSQSKRCGTETKLKFHQTTPECLSHFLLLRHHLVWTQGQLETQKQARGMDRKYYKTLLLVITAERETPTESETEKLVCIFPPFLSEIFFLFYPKPSMY